MGNGEIGRDEQFLLFPQYFQKIVLQGMFGRGLIFNPLQYNASDI